jgi:hypothetical protein
MAEQLKLEATPDNFHANIWYFRYEPIETDNAVINFGDGVEQPVFKPKGQITHQYDDGKASHTVTVTDGTRTATVQVPPQTEVKRTVKGVRE